MTKWQDIVGCFTFHEFYEWLAEEKLPSDDDVQLVEVGALYGQSASFLLEHMQNGKLDVVELSPNSYTLNANLGGPRMGRIHCPLSSVSASLEYADSSLDFVMLDAGHEYADLRSDIDAWWPKLRAEGILATHDYCHYFPGLMRAWNESFRRFNVWPCSLWPDATVKGQRLTDACADLRNRSALHQDTDYMPVAWVVK